MKTTNLMSVMALAFLPTLLVPSRAAAAELEAYTDPEIVDTASELIHRFGLSELKRVELVDALRVTLNRPHFKRARGTKQVTGVFVYTLGEGGLLVKFLGGKGLVAFKGQPTDGRLSFRSTSIGALIGGSRERGIGLIMGLEDEEDLGGIYVGTVAGAIGVTEGTMLTRMRRGGAATPETRHELVFIGRSEGLSANYGRARLTIALTGPRPDSVAANPR